MRRNACLRVSTVASFEKTHNSADPGPKERASNMYSVVKAILWTFVVVTLLLRGLMRGGVLRPLAERKGKGPLDKFTAIGCQIGAVSDAYQFEDLLMSDRLIGCQGIIFQQCL